MECPFLPAYQCFYPQELCQNLRDLCWDLQAVNVDLAVEKRHAPLPEQVGQGQQVGLVPGLPLVPRVPGKTVPGNLLAVTTVLPCWQRRSGHRYVHLHTRCDNCYTLF